MIFPRVEINLHTIEHNLESLLVWCGRKGIRLTPVTKGVCGAVPIARMFARHGIHSIGDSHIQNLIAMREEGIGSELMLLRAPMRHEMESVVMQSDYCLVSEMDTIMELQQAAQRYDRKYKIIVLIELGDRREGILVDDLDGFIPQVTSLKNIALSGIGVNLTCLNGIRPTAEKMNELSQIAGHLRKHFSLELGIVSGGNSANNQWLKEINDPGLVNHLRMGEAILLGTDPLTQAPMDGLQTGAFLLSAEVIESRRKPSLPDGIPTFTAFGDIPEFVDEGDMNRAIVAIGLQDVDPLGCAPVDPDFRIIGTTSDHMVIDSGDRKLSVGDVVQFNLTYRAMLPLMISPYVQKVFI